MNQEPDTSGPCARRALFSIMLRPCTAEILRYLLDPKIPFVWVVAHHPNHILEWWNCEVPLSKGGKPYPLDVRLLCYDLLMPTESFCECLSEFDGLVVHQMRYKVPNTLMVERLDEQNRIQILIQNGLAATFYLPHAHECASYKTVERTTMERALSFEAVRSLAY